MEDMFMILADGIPWEDSDGNTEWTEREVTPLASLLETMGYKNVEVISV
jgi:hypothetical protein